jgi:hypothetical protein
MSGSKISGVSSCSALWLWSLALGWTAPALAAEPAGPMLIRASSDAPVSAPAIVSMPATTEELREARRLLIDLPGSDPLSAATNEMLLFGTAPSKDDNDDNQEQILELDLTTEVEPDDDASDSEPAPAQPATVQPAETTPKTADVPAEKFSPEMLALCEKVRTVLARNYPRHQSAQGNSPWEVMHAIIAYGVDTQIYKEGPGSEKVNAIGYMCYNYPCRGQRMLLVNRGQIDASRGVGLQGHGGQFLAILAQSHVKNDYPMLVEGKNFTLQDLIEREKQTCIAGEELTFKLIALAHYLDPDATWTTPDGQPWSIERLVREELKAPIRGAACGGTHRLMGYSYAVKKRTQRGKPITGDFLRAQKYLQDYHRYTFNLQNPDGSFSTAWFERKANEPSIDRKVKTTGHILEWITFSLSDQELRDPRMVKAVDFLATTMLANDGHTWEIGPQGHALHALLLYEDRVFKNAVPLRTAPLAEGQAEVTPLEARRAEF